MSLSVEMQHMKCKKEAREVKDENFQGQMHPVSPY